MEACCDLSKVPERCFSAIARKYVLHRWDVFDSEIGTKSGYAAPEKLTRSFP